MGLFGNSLFAATNNAANATANNTAVENTPKHEPQKPLTEANECNDTLPSAPLHSASDNTPAQAPTAPVVKEKYVAPQSATEAKQRIEAAIEAGRVKQVPSSEDGQLQFVGKTFALQQAFRMLGGSFDKSASIWSVPAANWQNPEQCADLVQTELDKQAKRDESREAFEKRVNEAVEKRIAEERKKWEAEHSSLITPNSSLPKGAYTMEQMQAYSLKCIKVVLGQLSGMSDDKLKGVISKVAC